VNTKGNSLTHKVAPTYLRSHPTGNKGKKIRLQ